MIDMADAPSDGFFHLLKSGVRMTRVAADAALSTRPDKFLSTLQFGSDSGGDDAIGVGKIRFEFFPARRSQCAGGMAAMSLWGEVRAIEVGSQNAGPSGPDPFQAPASFEKSKVLFV